MLLVAFKPAFQNTGSYELISLQYLPGGNLSHAQQECTSLINPVGDSHSNQGGCDDLI